MTRKIIRRLLIAIVALVIVLVAGIVANKYVAARKAGDMKEVHFQEIAQGIYTLAEPVTHTNIYMVVGEEKAMLIDTGNGMSHLADAIVEVTDLPVMVVNTHGHFDSMGGNYQFDKVYIAEKEMKLAADANEEYSIRKLYHRTQPQISGWMEESFVGAQLKLPDEEEYEPLPERAFIELGDRLIKKIELPGHTAGAVGFLDVKTGKLFCGDALHASKLRIDLDESVSVEDELETLKMLKEFAHSGEITSMYTAHDRPRVKSDILDKYIDILEMIVNGELSEEQMQSGYVKANGVGVYFQQTKIEKNSTK